MFQGTVSWTARGSNVEVEFWGQPGMFGNPLICSQEIQDVLVNNVELYFRA